MLNIGSLLQLQLSHSPPLPLSFLPTRAVLHL
jgi:hypothetical protein